MATTAKMYGKDYMVINGSYINVHCVNILSFPLLFYIAEPKGPRRDLLSHEIQRYMSRAETLKRYMEVGAYCLTSNFIANLTSLDYLLEDAYIIFFQNCVDHLETVHKTC